MKFSERKKSNKYFTFLLIPHDSGKPLVSLKIPQVVLRFMLIVCLVSMLVFGGSLLVTTVFSGKWLQYRAAISKNAEHDKLIDSYASETNLIKTELQTLLDENNKIRKLLGMKIQKTKIYELEDIGKNSPKENNKIGSLNPETINKRLELSQKVVDDVKVSFDELKARVKDVMSKMANSPSTWPIYGSIISPFGYRSYPWRGLHTGVDITAKYGAPIRSTAPGVVSYVGWRTGYGKVVEITHPTKGISTLYAHLSKAYVTAGSKVMRGDVIAAIGTTGYSTGPHLHYEVRKWDKPINPAGFLNLDVRTACKYL